MRRFFISGAAILLSWTAHQSAYAQAVQLPSFHSFSVQTSVLVPDRGSAMLGGVDYARSGSTTRGFGPFRNRAFGQEVGRSQASVHATIIDHAELDRAVLAEAARRESIAKPALAKQGFAGRGSQAGLGDEGNRASRVAAKAEFLSRHVARRPE
jgi:hypothetical protein